MRTCVQLAPRLLLVVVLALLADARGPEGEEWQYSGHRVRFWSGPKTWYKSYPECGGKAQSPINLDPLGGRNEGALPRLHLHGYNVPPSAMTMRNTGHTVEVRVGAGSKVPRVSGGGLQGHYYLDQFHFHWAANAHRGGSEHTIDGHRFAGELHLVHHNDRYGSLQKAMNKPEGVAVLAVLLQLSQRDNPALHPIVYSLDLIENQGKEGIKIKPFRLDRLLPVVWTEVFRYNGSLTTPPCHESVVWTVFKNPITISVGQLKAFQSLTNYKNQPIQNNFRPLQPINGREILRGVLNKHG